MHLEILRVGKAKQVWCSCIRFYPMIVLLMSTELYCSIGCLPDITVSMVWGGQGSRALRSLGRAYGICRIAPPGSPLLGKGLSSTHLAHNVKGARRISSRACKVFAAAGLCPKEEVGHLCHGLSITENISYDCLLLKGCQVHCQSP